MLKFLMSKRNKKRGFTLIELIVVIAILAVLAAILVPSMLGILNNSKESVANANARSVYSAAQAAYVSLSSTGEAPTGTTAEPVVYTSSTSGTFIDKIIENLGNGFDGVYTVTVADGVTTVTWNASAGSTPTGNYPVA